MRMTDSKITQQEAADALGVSLAAFRRYAIEGEKVGRKKYYRVAELLEFYAEKKCKPLEKEILNLKAQILIEYDEGDSGGADSFKAQRMRLTRAQAEGQELKNDQVRGELINVNSAIQIFGKIIGEAITRLDSARSKIPTRVPGLKVTQYDAIDRVYSEARNNLADSDPQQIIDEALPNIT